MIKCEKCNGLGEYEKNVNGIDCPVQCIHCDGTGKQLIN